MTFRGMSVVVLCLLAFTHVQVSAQRLSVPFSYAWRFKLGHEPDASPGPNSCSTFDTDVSTLACNNIERNPNRHTAEDCATGCCYNPECYVWQHVDATRGCYWGGRDSVCSLNTTVDAPWPIGKITEGMQRKSVLPIRTEYKRGATDFDDSDWTIVDAPHDALFSPDNNFANQSDTHHGFRNRNVTWYRKHFTIPSSWKGSTISLYFEGSFHYTQLWLNGQFFYTNTAGYTSFTVRLDNVTSFVYDSPNVLAVRADATYGSGHWYEGGGLYRDVTLNKLDPVHIVQDGVFVHNEWDGSGPVPAMAEVENHGAASASSVTVRFDLMDGTKFLTSVTSAPQSVGTSGTTTFTVSLDVKTAGVTAWSLASPKTYSVVATVEVGGHPVDDVTVPAGFRSMKFTGAKGFFLNGENVKFRGFSHHNSLGGVGTAMTQRMYLFRAQVTRAVGGNFWRNSHNPYTPKLYPILNELGILNWDENRDHGPWYVQQMHNMVKRDRNHPAIACYSTCNEAECGAFSNTTGEQFRAAALAVDPTRAIAANQGTWGWSAEAPQALDVSGWSHSKNITFTTKHADHPDLPLVLSECCSCMSQRPDRDLPDCIRDQNDPGEMYDFVSGSLGVWTLMDYYGESHTWPRVSSPYGQFDIAGFPKPHAHWYVANWNGLVPASDPSRPPVPVQPVVKVLTLLDQPLVNFTTVSTQPKTRLSIDGNVFGTASTTPGYEHIWSRPASAPKHNVTAEGLDSNGDVAVSHTVYVPGAASGVKLDIDVPSPITGTGSALLLDGSDTALLRVTVVDANGRMVSSSSVNVTFEVVSGPGRVIAIANGDPGLLTQPHSSTVSTYYGLARGFVQVAYDCTSPHRDVVVGVDIDGNRRTKVVPQGQSCPTDPIVIKITSEGLQSSTVSIPTSVNTAVDSPVAVAKANVHLKTFTYMDIQA